MSQPGALNPVSLRITHRTRAELAFHRPFFSAPWFHEAPMRRTAGFASKFTHSCGVSERREVKGERQVMPPLVLLIIFQVSFSFNLLFANLFANWRLSPEFWSPIFFPLAMATKTWSAGVQGQQERWYTMFWYLHSTFKLALVLTVISKPFSAEHQYFPE